MKKIVILLGSFVLVVALSGISSAQAPGTTIYVQCITADRPITIDGDLSDWVDQGYEVTYTQADMSDVLGGEMQPLDDWSCVGYCGWSPDDNMLYAAISVTDDMNNADCGADVTRYEDDGLEMAIDADNSGGMYKGAGIHGVQGQQICFHPNPPAGIATAFVYGEAGINWIVDPLYCKVASNLDDLPNWKMEVKLAIWDRVDPTGGADASDRHILKADETIGWAIAVDDVDADPAIRDCQPGLPGPEGAKFFKNADHINDAVLLPCPAEAVGSCSWGKIKALFK